MQLQYSPEPIRAVAFERLVTNPLILCTLFLGMCCHLVAILGSAWESGPQAMWSPSEVTDRRPAVLPPSSMDAPASDIPSVLAHGQISAGHGLS